MPNWTIGELTRSIQVVLFAKQGEDIRYLQHHAEEMEISYVFHNNTMWMNYNNNWIPLEWKKEDGEN